MTLDIEDQGERGELQVRPTLEQLRQAVVAIKENMLDQLFRDHRLYQEDKEGMCIENLEEDEDEEHPTKFELKYYILKNP